MVHSATALRKTAHSCEIELRCGCIFACRSTLFGHERQPSVSCRSGPTQPHFSFCIPNPPPPPVSPAYDNEEVNARNIVPTSVKQLRACKKCHLVKTYEQFMQIGCENCDDSYNRSALDLDEKEHSVANSTSANFSGLIAYMFDDDRASWVARCHALRMDHADARRKPGVYAMQLNADEALEEGFDDED